LPAPGRGMLMTRMLPFFDPAVMPPDRCFEREL
jgi:hypothetical protein